jgi:putative oxidoreductase
MSEPTGRAAPDPDRGSILAVLVDRLVALCGIVPYALVALGLRLLMARVFFLPGQTRIVGPSIPIGLFGRDDVVVVLPADITDATLQLFQTQYAALPLPPNVAAYLFTYAEFVLPICLAVGFATRIAALLLLAMTILLQIYVAPGALWSAHAYWMAILLVLMSVGPGAVSIDAVIRRVYEW